MNIQKSTNQNMTIQNCNSTKYTSVIHTNQKQNRKKSIREKSPIK